MSSWSSKSLPVVLLAGGYIPPAEAEDRYYLQLTTQAEYTCT